jgi:phytoene dehydrogenase-like protein
LGEDEGNYRNLIAPVVKDWAAITAAFFAPPHWPRRPLAVARFGLHAMQPARRVAEKAFTTVAGRALFAGLAAHAMIPLEEQGSAAVGMVLAAAAHRGGWPLARGGAGAITQAMAAHLRELGGEIVTGRRIGAAGELPEHEVAFADVGASALAGIWGERLPRGYRRQLEDFQPGPGVFKLDWALSGPIPWTAHACRGAGTVHLGGTLEEIAASEASSCAARGAQASERPFVLLSQASLFDPTRAPAGLHTAWAYCHVPNDSGEDMTQRIENQVERFAPGFRSLILARSARGPKELERGNANLVGGDIGGGRNSLRQLVLRPGVARPPFAGAALPLVGLWPGVARRQRTPALAHGVSKLPRWGGYRTPLGGVYLCSSSTPPGGGVHGLCGANAARLALHEAARR